MTISAETLDILRRVSTATLTFQLLKKHGMRSRTVQNIRPLTTARCRFVGPASTLRYVPAREDLEPQSSIGHPANPAKGLIETMPAGGVMVIDMQGSVAGGALGDVLIARLIARGIAGVVADGAMRDAGPLAAMAMPVFCRGVTAPPSFNGLLAIEKDVPIGCGGVLVYPGDIVVADEDGVIVIPRHLAEQTARDGLDQEQMEAWIKRRIEAGESIEGLYPPSAATVAAYRASVAAG
jgi:regulator of RNase E activity RraA